MDNWQQTEKMPRKWRRRGGEEDRHCDEGTALRDIWSGRKMEKSKR